jgi:hypothetical protein
MTTVTAHVCCRIFSVGTFSKRQFIIIIIIIIIIIVVVVIIVELD